LKTRGGGTTIYKDTTGFHREWRKWGEHRGRLQQRRKNEGGRKREKERENGRRGIAGGSKRERERREIGRAVN